MNSKIFTKAKVRSLISIIKNHRYCKFLLISIIFQIALSSMILILMYINDKLPNGASVVFSAWDAHHYQYLAKYGYVNHGIEGLFIVFFPFYPFVIHLALFLIPSVIYASLFVSAAFSIFAHFLYLVLLDKLNLGRGDYLLSAGLFFLTPINAYFFAAYTESLYMFLTLAFFTLLIKRKYLTASLVGMCASLTRSVGVLLILPFLYQLLVDKTIKPAGHLIKTLLIILGSLIYLGINLIVYGDPLYFQYVLKTNWYKTTVNPVNTILSLLKGLPLNILRGNFPVTSVDIALVLLLPIILILYGLGKRHKLPFGWMVWVFANWIVVVSQSFLLSSARYILILFPLYIAIPLILPKRNVFLPLSVILLLVFGYLSIRGLNIYSTSNFLY